MVNHMRHTRSQSAQRRSHHALQKRILGVCPDCGKPKLSHVVCMNCGKYNGRVVIDMAAKIAKNEKKAKARNAEATNAR